MAAYVIVDISVTNPDRFEEYRKLAGASVAAQGGKYLVRGGKMEVLEGGWRPRRVVVIEFPSIQSARQWWSSPQYEEARRVRAGAANMRMIVVEGAP